jgi:hypothetical protein
MGVPSCKCEEKNMVLTFCVIHNHLVLKIIYARIATPRIAEVLII